MIGLGLRPTHTAALGTAASAPTSLFDDAVWLTDPAHHTVTRTGARKSLFRAGASLSTLLVSNDLTTWYTYGGVSVGHQGGGVYRVAVSGRGGELIEAITVVGGLPYYSSLEYRYISGDTSGLRLRHQRNGPPWTSYASASMTDTSGDWVKVDITSPHVPGNTRLRLGHISGLVDGVVVEFRHFVAVQGTYADPFPLGSPAGTALSDAAKLGPAWFTGVSDGATNVVSADVTDPAWQVAGATVPVAVVSAGVYAITFHASGGAAGRFFGYGSRTSDVTLTFDARLDSGVTGTLTQAAVRNLSTTIAFADLSGINSTWQTYRLTVPAGTPTDRVMVRSDNNSAFVLHLRNIRVAAAASPYPAFPDGSGAGASYGADHVIVPPHTFAPGPMTIVGIGIPYGWTGNFAENTYERWFDLGTTPAPRLEYAGSGMWQAKDDQTFTENYPGHSFDAPQTFSFDCDGLSTVGSRVGDSARSTGTGNGPDFQHEWAIGSSTQEANRHIHGVLALAYFSRVLSDAEYAQARTQLLNAWNNRGLI